MGNDSFIEIQLACLTNITKLANYDLSNEQLDQFSKYLVMLLQWNKRTNLVSKNDEKDIVKKHFLESIAIFDVINFPYNSSIIDVGTGAGFPGLPMKIIRPDLKFTLLDSKRLKILFLKDVLLQLNLTDVNLVNQRAEIACFETKLNRKFDFVITRAVTTLINLYEWTNPFLKPGAGILAIKGGNVEKEIRMLQKKYNKIEIKILPMKSPLLNKDRNIVIVRINLNGG